MTSVTAIFAPGDEFLQTVPTTLKLDTGKGTPILSINPVESDKLISSPVHHNPTSHSRYPFLRSKFPSTHQIASNGLWRTFVGNNKSGMVRCCDCCCGVDRFLSFNFDYIRDCSTVSTEETFDGGEGGGNQKSPKSPR